jgi:streptogramin lyase
MKIATRAKLLVAVIILVQTLPTSGAERRRASPSVLGPSHYQTDLDGVTALAPGANGSVWFAPDFLSEQFAGHLSVDGTVSKVPIQDAGFAVIDSDGSLWLGAGKAIARIR